MRALVYDGALRLDNSVREPKPERDQALLRIRRAGVCNTDLELMAGMYNFSGILGHEFVAEVVQGPDNLVGRRVVGEINVACTMCDFCRKGIPSHCRNRKAIGIHDHPGAFADYLALVSRNLHVVPDELSDDRAVFTEPLAAALQVAEGVHISPRDRVVVLGVGKLGMLVAQVLNLTGADVVGVVRRENQVELLNRWKIPAVGLDELEHQKAQVVVDCTGQPDGFATALQLVESRGTIVLKSSYHGLTQADLSQLAVREIHVVGSRCGPFEAALRLLYRGVIDVESLIQARFDFGDAVTALEHAGTPGVLKVLLDF